jgi:catechol 2,3-dioxygenase-like lactoylglutathione lyase family enzyme
MIKALSKLDVITLFVEDLTESKTFYTGVFDLEVIYEDDASAVVKMSNLIINLLRVSNCPGAGRADPGRRARRLSCPADDRGRRRERGVRGAAGARREAAQRPDRPAVGQAHGGLRRPGGQHLGDRAGLVLEA